MGGIGHNSQRGADIPADRGEAIRYVYSRLLKLMADDKQYRSHIAGTIKTFRAEHKLSASSCRLAIRLGSMSPEKREQWAADVRVGCQLFGYSGLDVADTPDRDKAPLWHMIRAVELLADDRKGVKEEIKSLIAAARSREDINGDAIVWLCREFTKGKDAVDIADWHGNVDVVATFLSVW